MGWLIARASELKKLIRSRTTLETLRGRVVGMLFEKPSTRTRASFETASFRLGGSPMYLSAGELQLSRGEPVSDTARILGSYVDVLVGRVYSHDTLVQLEKYSGVPVINALSDLEHPTQTVTDLMTLMEAKGRLGGTRLAYVGDGNNVCNSLILGSALTGVELSVACPEGYDPDPGVIEKAKKISKSAEGKPVMFRRPEDAVSGADAVYTDVWVSMGQESEKEKRMKDFAGYQVNAELLKSAKPDAIVMHCLPAHRGLEISEEVLEGPKSVAWEQGENKLYGAGAALEWSLKTSAKGRS
jgi:ornithine carbamoyltransferase